MPADDYTPDDAEVRRAYTVGMRQAFITSAGVHGEEFDRWFARVRAEAVGAPPTEAEVNLAAMTWVENGPTPASWYGMPSRRREAVAERMRIVLTAVAEAHAARADTITQEDTP